VTTDWCRAFDSPPHYRAQRVDTERSHALVLTAMSAVHIAWMLDKEDSLWRCGGSPRVVSGGVLCERVRLSAAPLIIYRTITPTVLIVRVDML